MSDSSRPRILVVDDDFAQLELLNAALSDRYLVMQAETGRDAIKLATQHRPNLILLDITMPGLSGADVLGILRKTPETKDVPIIICSAIRNKDAIQHMMDLGANAFENKPLDFDKLEARIQELISS